MLLFVALTVVPSSVCAFSVDDSYVVPFQVFLHSLYLTSSIPLSCDIYILHSAQLSPASVNILRLFISGYGYRCHFCDVSALSLPNLPIDKRDHVAISTFYRLFVADLLPEGVDLVVYLDSDMIALRSISSLFALKFSGQSLLAAVDHCEPREGLRLWGDSGGTYFQAGVLVVPLGLWRQRLLTEKFLDTIIYQRDKIRWHDQDVLNLVIGSNWMRLPVWLNVCHSHLPLLTLPDIEENASIIHFSGAHKPWNSYDSSPFNYCWDRVYFQLYGRSFDRRALKPPRFPRIRHIRSRILSRIKDAFFIG